MPNLVECRLVLWRVVSRIPLDICSDLQGMPYILIIVDPPYPSSYIQLWLQDGHDHQMDRRKGAWIGFLLLLVLVTPPKANMDTQNGGLEKAIPLKYGIFWYLC